MIYTSLLLLVPTLFRPLFFLSHLSRCVQIVFTLVWFNLFIVALMSQWVRVFALSLSLVQRNLSHSGVLELLAELYDVPFNDQYEKKKVKAPSKSQCGILLIPLVKIKGSDTTCQVLNFSSQMPQNRRRKARSRRHSVSILSTTCWFVEY